MNKSKTFNKSVFIFLIIIIVLSVIIFSGCKSSNNYDNSASEEAGGITSPKVVLNQTNRKIIYSVDIELITNDYNNTIATIYGFIFDNPDDNHWISSDQENSYDGGQTKTRKMTLKIKTEKLNDFLSTLPDIGEIQHYSLSTQDITYDYAETQAEKSALEEERAYYQGLLANLEEESHSYTSNYFELTNKIKNLTSQIKLVNDELTKYDNELDFSLVTLSIMSYTEQQEPTKVVLSFSQRIKKAFYDTTNFLGKAFKWIFVALIYVFPFAIIGGAIAFAIVFINRKIQARRKGRQVMEKIKAEMDKEKK